jgi:hypothetical protein
MTWGHFMTGRWQAGTSRHPEVAVPRSVFADGGISPLVHIWR